MRHELACDGFAQVVIGAGREHANSSSAHRGGGEMVRIHIAPSWNAIELSPPSEPCSMPEMGGLSSMAFLPPPSRGRCFARTARDL